MKLLALDSSGLVASVAIMEDDTLLAEYSTNYKKTHSQTLLPMLEELRRMVELDMESIDAIAVASGPGSFTGLRIGAATAKGLGLALNKPIVEVPTLEGLAYNMCGAEGFVCPLMDARRNQVYTGIYEFVRPNGEKEPWAQEPVLAGVPMLRVVEPQAAVDIREILAKANALGKSCPGRQIIFLGDGAEVYGDMIRRVVSVPYIFAPAGSRCQRAASVAALGAVYYRMGRIVTAAEHRPEYLRKSQAEREFDGSAGRIRKNELC